MKKILSTTLIVTSALFYSSYASADHYEHHHDHPHHGHHYGHHHGHHGGYYAGYQPHVVIAPQPPVYVAQPPVYYAPPPVQYHPVQQPRYGYYDQRTGTGLVGGVLGSVIGYEIGNGDPIAAGLGAAAGSYIGNR